MPQLLAHLFGDYILQSDWMAQGKTQDQAEERRKDAMMARFYADCRSRSVCVLDQVIGHFHG